MLRRFEARHVTVVMMLGAGELSRELVTAFQRLGARVTAVDHYADAPIHDLADRSVVVKMTDPDALTALIEREQPDYVVTDPDEAGGLVVANDALAAIAERGLTDVVPTARASRLSLDREGLRRLAADRLGLPTAPFWFAGSAEELGRVARHAGFPLVVRPVAAAAGQGESVLLRERDVVSAWEHAIAAGERLANTRVMAETMVEIDHEITLLTVRTAGRSGARVQFCEPIGHRRLGGGALEAWQPQQLADAALDVAKSVAARIVNALGGRGVYAVELAVKGSEVYFVDVSPRPYDTGLVTLRSQRLSEFELHARAILGLPVDTIMVSPGAVQVIYAHGEAAAVDDDDEGRTERAAQALSDALAVPESDVRIFGSPGSAPRRVLAVALATASNVKAARDRARQVAAAFVKDSGT